MNLRERTSELQLNTIFASFKALFSQVLYIRLELKITQD